MTDNATDKDWLLIGRVVGAHGLNGHVKIYPESDFPERFTEPGERWLRKSDAEPMPIQLTSGRYLEGKNSYLVKLAGIDFRDQAEDLRSAQLLVPVGDRLPLDPGEFHVNDLIGLAVVLRLDQTTIGTITNVFTTGHDLLEVTLSVESNPPLETQTSETQTSEIEASEIEASEIKALEPENHPSLRAKAAQKLRRKAKRKNKPKRPKTLLIPFVEDIVPVVDIAAGRVEITPPEGLIDLA